MTRCRRISFEEVIRRLSKELGVYYVRKI